ncbi:hypothetical protein DLJ49_21260 [Rhodovulum sp. 12E13]|nr:hypothetical protein DLJ49_21260 [Rhodovulum sp. 12E13]
MATHYLERSAEERHEPDGCEILDVPGMLSILDIPDPQVRYRMIQHDVFGRDVHDFRLPAARFGDDNPDINALIDFESRGQLAAGKVSDPSHRQCRLSTLIRSLILLGNRPDLETGDGVEDLAR